MGSELSNTISRGGCLLVLVLAAALISGCGSGGTTMGQPLPAPHTASQTNAYSGTQSPLGSSSGGVWTFTVDRGTSTFSYTAVSYPSNTNPGNSTPAGTFINSSGFLNLTQTNVTPNRFTGYSFEIPGRLALLRPGINPNASSNALVVMPAQQSCININGVATFQFVTMPTANWAVNTAAAFGSVQAMTSGSTWTFPNLQQFTLAGTSTNPAPMPMATCGSAPEGNVISIPAPSTTAPNNAATTIIIGPSGFFVEDLSTGDNSNRGYPGLVGVIQPSSPLDANAVLGASYLGFRFEPNVLPATAPKTQPVAFAPATAPAVGLTGGVYPSDNLNSTPLTDTNINLGPQDPANNGLYRSATITIPGPTSTCGASGRCVLPAGAVVGNPENKFAIFLIAQNRVNNSPIGIYLLQQ